MTDLVRRLQRSVVPAVPVPFTASGVIDSAALAAYVEWMRPQRVGAVAVNVHTGRGAFLKPEQRTQVIDAWVRGGHPVICGAGVPAGTDVSADPGRRTDQIIDLTVAAAREAQDRGAAGVLLHPPSMLRDGRDVGARVIALHEAVAEIGLPVLAFYLYERAGGVAYDDGTVTAILAIDGVIGIKVATLDSVMRFQELAAIVRRVPDTLLVSGEDRFLGYSLMSGADGALIGMAAACTDRMVQLLDRWFEGDAAAFLALSAAIDRFATATFVEPMEGYVQRMLWALEADGVIDAGARDPYGPTLAATEVEVVRRAVAALRAA